MVRTKSLPNFTKLGNSQVKKLIEPLTDYYDTNLDHLYKFKFYSNARGRVFISPIDVFSVEFDRINSIGLYFGTLNEDERFRLTIEGTQMINPKKNIVMLNEESLKSYLAGESLFFEEVEFINRDGYCPYLIVKYGKHCVGVVSTKGDKELLNYVSKGKRLDYNKVF